MIVRRYWLYMVGALALGILAGAAWPPPPLPKLDTRANAWSLPPAEDMLRHVPQDMGALASGIRWLGDAGGISGEASAWRLAGIVHDAGPAILVMTAESPDKAQRVAIGGRLPDGTILQSVDGDRAFTRRDNCITSYQLFHATLVDKSDGCEEPEVPDQGTSE